MGEVVEAALINLLSELICRVDRVDILQHAIDDSEEFLAHLNIFVAVIDRLSLLHIFSTCLCSLNIG